MITPDMRIKHAEHCPCRVDDTCGMYNACRCDEQSILKEFYNKERGCIDVHKTYDVNSWHYNQCSVCHKNFVEVTKETVCNRCQEVIDLGKKNASLRSLIKEMVNDINILIKENSSLRNQLRNAQIKSGDLIPMDCGNHVEWGKR